MLRINRILGILTLATSLVIQGCFGIPVVAAPGADKVRLTQQAAEVAHCTAVGNAQIPSGESAATPAEFQNQAVGLGGNTVLITKQYMSSPISGIIYRCPQGG